MSASLQSVGSPDVLESIITSSVTLITFRVKFSSAYFLAHDFLGLEVWSGLGFWSELGICLAIGVGLGLPIGQRLWLVFGSARGFGSGLRQGLWLRFAVCGPANQMRFKRDAKFLRCCRVRFFCPNVTDAKSTQLLVTSG